MGSKSVSLNQNLVQAQEAYGQVILALLIQPRTLPQNHLSLLRESQGGVYLRVYVIPIEGWVE